jgi:diaminohydroxyphosphoribosylaminopyrimidine deaminase/5-amino-6-(5-phosphoribosylamino)uracil reductase
LPLVTANLPPGAAAHGGATVDALWDLCLAVARARRGAAERGSAAAGPARLVPTGYAAGTAVAGPALAWQPGEGWRLEGLWPSPAQALFALFKPLLDRLGDGPVWVIGQLGQSLDGCVATRAGDSCFVNGPENLVHLHRLRALCDAVMVGAGTVAADDPRLTTRRVPGPNPVRVVLDPQRRLPPAARVFCDAAAPTLWLCDARFAAAAAPAGGGVEVVAVEGLLRADGGPHLPAVLATLQARGLRLLFVEGGGVTVSRFLAQGCLDRLHLAVAPVIIGDGRPGLRFAGPPRLADCPRPACSVYPMGADQLWDLDLRRAAPVVE